MKPGDVKARTTVHRSEAGSVTNAGGADASVHFLGVGKTYLTRTGIVEAVRDVTFDVADGEFVSLVGPSGCGKSTVLKMVAGLISHDIGEVRVAGAPPRAGRREIGIMLQSPVLFPWRTVLENVLLPIEVFGGDRVKARERASEILEIVGLSGFERTYPWELSGGMQQRASLSRLLLFQPSVFLLDEPFAALDEFTRERLNLELAALHDELRPTVLYVTHNIVESVFLADRVIVMTPRPGRVVAKLEIALPRPRTPSMIDSPSLLADVKRIRTALSRDGHES